MIGHFKRVFSVFKQQYTYFYTLFYLYVFQNTTNNTIQIPLSNRPYITKDWFGLHLKGKRCVFIFLCGSHVLFIELINMNFSQFFFKIEYHSTIYTFKNYFVTVFSIFNKVKSYGFSNGKKRREIK